MEKNITLPKWDGVSRVKTARERNAERKAERQRREAMTKEERIAEEQARDADRIRKQYWDNPDSISRQTLSRNSFLQAEFEDWKQRHPEKSKSAVALHNGKLRASAEKLRSVRWKPDFDKFVWQELLSLRGARQFATGIKWDIDHMLPLRGKKVSGLHIALNWQLIPRWMNNQKLGRTVLTEPDEWLRYFALPSLPPELFSPWLAEASRLDRAEA